MRYETGWAFDDQKEQKLANGTCVFHMFRLVNGGYRPNCGRSVSRLRSRAMTDAELIEKLKRIEETSDHAERHSLALELADNPDRRIFDVLVRLIQRPDLENRRGTLIYCLEAHDCASITPLLEHIAKTGNFEAGMQAEVILDDQGLR